MTIVRQLHTPDKPPSALLDHALAYAARGLLVIPTYFDKTLAVRWKTYQAQRPTESTLRRLFAETDADGLAVIHGKPSNGLACRDFDVAAAYHRWAAQHPDLAATLPTVRTHRGFHVYHRARAEQFATLSDGEYRGDSGHCTVLPPSPHPKGTTYSWAIPLSDTVPLLDPFGVGLLSSSPRQPSSPGTPRRPLHVRQVETSQVGNSGLEQAVEQAIIATLPTGFGQRNRRVFDLARRLKGIPALARLPAPDLRQHVVEWHLRALPTIRTKDFEASWVDFVVAWGRIRRPGAVGESPALAMASAMNEPLCVAAKAYALPEVQRLVMLCRELARGACSGTFYLSCNDAAGAIGASDSKAAWRWLQMLLADGVLELVRKGRATPQSGVASEYRYLGD